MVPQKEEKKVIPKINYLREQEEKRAKKGVKPDFYYRSKEIKRHLKDASLMSPKDQFDEVKEFSRMLNEKAAMKIQEIKTDSQSMLIFLISFI